MNLVDISKGIETHLQTTLSPFDGTLTRTYDAKIETPEEKFGELAQNVFVIPMGVEFREAASRLLDRNVYKIGIAFGVRYEGKLAANVQSAALTEFIDEQIEYVERCIYLPLKSPDFSPVQGAYLEDINWREVFNVDISRTYNLFWSEIDVEYFIDETNT